MFSANLDIRAKLTAESNGDSVRYEFSLFNIEGVKHDFIIDLPEKIDGSVDVWMVDSTVQVGDTPADGFATFTHNEQKD